jgi:hypothetical protein
MRPHDGERDGLAEPLTRYCRAPFGTSVGRVPSHSQKNPAGPQALRHRGEEFMDIRSGLAACGVLAAVAIAASGCGSSSSTVPAAAGGGGGSGAAAAGGGASGSAVGAGSSGSGAATSANPSWTAGLGSGVTVYAPTSASAGNGTPQAAVTGFVAAVTSGNFASVCAYYEPSAQSQCNSAVSAETSASPSALASQVGISKNFTIGYTAVRGDQALVGATGTFCASGKCSTNTDPAALFSSGKTFDALWSTADNQDASIYSLTSCIEVDGKWYLYQPASSPSSSSP